MKISLAWLFDHLEGDLCAVNVPDLVDQFNLKVAEIESFAKVELDRKQFTVGRVMQVGLEVELFAPELNQNLVIASRSDVQINSYYLLKRLDLGWTWAGGKDFNSQKENLLPALDFQSDLEASKWYDQVEFIDYILEIDNKSLTHRPDLWGHRGLAREIAVLLDLNLRPDEDFYAKIPMQEFAQKFVGNHQEPISVDLQARTCTRFASLYLKNVRNLPSQLKMAVRLFRVDLRSINYLVDLTNYVMLDVSQPMHVYDADLIAQQQLVVRFAQAGEKIRLLGEQELQLDQHDLVIADGCEPIALAGIKGGAGTGSNPKTQNLLLEAANFDATSIRHSSAKHKLRTEASARFEKTLDPSQNVLALERFVKLYLQIDPDFKINTQIISLGIAASMYGTKKIEIAHDFIEKRLGIKIAPDFVLKVLTKLGFKIVEQKNIGEVLYQVTVPASRASKDINIAVDLVEEVARIYGYNQITPVLPSKVTQPGNLDSVFRIRQIKQFLASLGMHEVENYPFYDETFLQEIKWQTYQAVEVRNPVSENWRRLVTSLLPHLCKNVQQESREYNELRYFEWGRVWHPKDQNSALEMRVLSGLFFNRDGLDFYAMKSYLVNLFHMLKIEVVWQKTNTQLPVWYHPYQTASLMHAGKSIGTAGKLSQGWMSTIAEGEAFGFEIDGDFILANLPKNVVYQELSKFQQVYLDVSLFVPLAIAVDDLQATIKQVDARIYQVELVDSFKKDDWLDKKALTFRYFFVDQEKTLSGADIAIIQQQVEVAIQKNGVSVR